MLEAVKLVFALFAAVSLSAMFAVVAVWYAK